MFRTTTPSDTGKPQGRPGIFAWLLCLCGVAGGVLWALSPLGARLSAEVLRAPELFWRLFPSAPFAMLLGLFGIYLCSRDRGGLVRGGFVVAAVGAIMVIAGDISLYVLNLDDIFIMSAPSYLTLRAGLLVFTFGTLFFGLSLARLRGIALVGALPLTLGALAGGIAVLGDFGTLGAGMWVFFGGAFAWCSFVLSVGAVVSFFRGRKARRQARS